MSVEIKVVGNPDQSPVTLSVDPGITIQNLKPVISKREELKDFIAGTPSFRLNLYLRKAGATAEGEKLDARKKLNELDLGPNDVILVKVAGGVISVEEPKPPTPAATAVAQPNPPPTETPKQPVPARSLPAVRPTPTPPGANVRAQPPPPPASAGGNLTNSGPPPYTPAPGGNLSSSGPPPYTPAPVPTPAAPATPPPEEAKPEPEPEPVEEEKPVEEPKPEEKEEEKKRVTKTPSSSNLLKREVTKTEKQHLQEKSLEKPVQTATSVSTTPTRPKNPPARNIAVPASITSAQATTPANAPTKAQTSVANKPKRKKEEESDFGGKAKIIYADTMQGLVNMKGTSNNNHKWETFWCISGGGQFTICDKDTKVLKEVLPMTYLVLDEIKEKDKKDKPPTKFSFAIVDAKNKKFRNVFCVDSDKELSLWVTAIAFSVDMCTPAVFGSTLKIACLKANKLVPVIMETCINYIDQYLNTEGVFRIPANKRETDEAQALYDTGGIPDFLEDDPHLPCTLLKGYLRDLKEPLIPFVKYQDFLNIATLPENQRLEALKRMAQDLPALNRIVLAYLLQFLTRVCSHSSSNKMDVNNVALVFAPTIFRAESSDVSIGDMGAGTEVMRLMIDKHASLFTADELHMWQQTCVTYSPEIEVIGEWGRMIVTPEEREHIVQHIAPHHGPYIGEEETVYDNTVLLLVNMKINRQNHNPLEPRVFVGDKNRVYIFMSEGGRMKMEHEFHLLDIKEVLSPSPAAVSITYQHKLRQDAKSITISLSPISYGSFDTDAMVHWINSMWERNFIGKSSKFQIKIGPAKRADILNDFGKVADPMAGCAGFVNTYHCVSDFASNEINPRITWDLENYYYPNGYKKFAVLELVPKDKFPNLEFQTLIQALRHNLWFTSFKSTDLLLGNDSAAMLARMFHSNKTIETFVMTNAGVSKKGIEDLCKSFSDNPNLALTKLDISGNTFDSKTIPTFCDCLCNSLGKLKYLNLSNTQLPQKKGVSQVLESLGRTVLLVNSLTYLNLSDNKFDAESSHMLGVFLTLTRALSTLEISGTSPVFGKIVEAMSGNSLQTCTHLKTLNISHNPIVKKKGENDDFIKLLMFLPEVNELNIGGTHLPTESMEILVNGNRKLTTLDISDNDLTDDGIISLMKCLSTSAGQSTITTLKMNRVFNRRTATRQHAMSLIARALNTIPIEEFEIQGDKRGGKGLKADLLDIVFGLLNNKTLTKLDVSGNQAGDDLGIALGKVFQHNNTLNTLTWDGNDIGIIGFKALKLGLERNVAMQHLEISLEDIFALKAKQEVNPELLNTLIKDIQKVISENQRQKAAAVEAEEDKTKKKKVAVGTAKDKKKKAKKKNPPLDVDLRRASVAFLYNPRKNMPPPTGAPPSSENTLPSTAEAPEPNPAAQ